MRIKDNENPKPRECSLDDIREELGQCQRCPLGQTRTHIVFGAGNPHARVVIVGEAPGKNEDLAGEPFIGAAGKNLSGLLELAGLTRDDVYIANVLKCRPPANRNPRVGEIQQCSPFLREQIRSIWPDVIVCLGNFATHFILRTDEGITTLRGRMHRAGHFNVFPTYHPAAALYNQSLKPVLEADFVALGQWLNNHPSQQ